ncbi:uncharacterized protein [Antedon mediterranea]|uniref:uncharacterized protein n=1 Tax=Antedon mediterranea TaxID=105859 RepID=UPI003AF429F6
MEEDTFLCRWNQTLKIIETAAKFGVHEYELVLNKLHPCAKVLTLNANGNEVVLGTGTYGKVLLHRFEVSNGELVAVNFKVIATTTRSGKFNRFIDKLTVLFEARIMMVLSQESDVFPRIYGVCEAVTSDTQSAIVMEFVGDSTSFKSTYH